jgi:MFS family permease
METADPGAPAAPAPIPRNVKALGVVSLLTDASSEMVYPVLPLFLANVLGAPVAAIGLIESVAEATASFLKVFSGWLSDRVGRRRPLIVLGYTISNIAKPLLALTASWPAVLLLRFSDRFGKGVRTAPRDALIADSGRAARRGRDFGFHRALDTLGAALGPLAAFAILSLAPGGYRTVFWVSAVPGTLAILVVFAAVREARAGRARGGERDEGRSPGPGEAPPHPPAFRLQHLGRPFALFTGASAVFALGNSSDALLILRAQDVGAAPALIPLMYFVFNVVGAALATPLGALSDRVGRRALLAAGFGGYALVYAGFALARAPQDVWLLFALYGVPYAMTEGMARAYVCDLVPAGVRATALGGYTFVLGLAALPASAAAGVLWDAVGHAAPFAVSAALMAAAAVLLAAVPQRSSPARARGFACGASGRGARCGRGRARSGRSR